MPLRRAGTHFTSPEGRGRLASSDARRVRGYDLSIVRKPLTRICRFAPNPTSPLRGEVNGARRALPVAQAVGGALPLRDVFRDDAGRLHRGLAELGVAGDLALHALALGMQQVA